MKRFVAAMLCLLLLLPLGCTVRHEGQRTEVPVEPTEELGWVTVEPKAEPDPAEITGTVGDLSFDTVTLYGEPIRADVVKGYDLVIVNFWAEWCGPCVGELPELQRIHEEYPNVLILGVLVSTDSVDLAKSTLENAGVTYLTLEPVGSLVAMSMRSQYIPATYFFDGEGHEIGSEIVGSQDYEGWKATVEELLH